MLTEEAPESIHEIQITAAQTGRDLRPFDQLEVATDGYEEGVGIAINFPGLAIRVL